MEDQHRNVIRCNIDRLVNECDIDQLLPVLEAEGVFMEAMLHDYQCIPDKRQLSEAIFESIQRRGPKAFGHLLRGLLETGQTRLVTLLDPARNGSQHFPQGPRGANPFVLPREEIALQVNVKHSERFYDSHDGSDSVPMYRIRSRSRGAALVINNIKFEHDTHQFREGAQVDSANICSLFNQIGLKVFLYENLELEEFTNALLKFKTDDGLQTVDLVMVCIMSHGGMINGQREGVYTTDNVLYNVDDIIDHFNNEKCEALKNKPKIFLIQACRGKLRDQVQNDSVSSTVVDSRNKTDILIGHSTLEGYVAHRDTELGSWYIQKICEVFMRHAHNKCVEDLLKIVDEEIAPLRTLANEMQTSSYKNIAFRKCFLHPGIYIENGTVMKIPSPPIVQFK